MSEAEAEAAEAAEEREHDSVFDDVPMSDSDINGVSVGGRDVPSKATATSSRGENFDVDFDVSSVMNAPRHGR